LKTTQEASAAPFCRINCSVFSRAQKEKKEQGWDFYICKSIIEEHMGGRITAENTDHGAKFTIFLPIDQTITKER